ncbi:MAG: hypothetical protein E7048_04765 [Lentisphaerae bacterium]|nr:hypothetical protein [Lentisphaerota bacterium]
MRNLINMNNPSSDAGNFWLLPQWYPQLAAHTFITTFVPLPKDAIALLKAGELDDLDEEERIDTLMIEELRQPMAEIPGNCFVCVDSCAPTDTERFRAKGGAVYSPRSAWQTLRQSEKVRKAAQEGLLTSICLRPYRNMTSAREFRLFIKDGKLKGMSQYHLTRHFRRLEGIKETLWSRCQLFINAKSWRLPKEPLVMDVYFTSNYERIMIVDLNPWSSETDPKLFKWDEDWDSVPGLRLMKAPAEN